MYANTTLKHPPVHAVIWDLDGMVIQFKAKDGETSVADLEALVRFILALCQEYTTAILGRQPVMSTASFARFEKLLFPMNERQHDDYLTVARRLEVSPHHAVVVAIDPQHLDEANRLGFLTVAFQNPRQAVSQLLPMLAEPLET